MLVGEFGIPAERGKAPEYLERLYSVFDELHLSGTIWEISMSKTLWNFEDISLLEADGSERPAVKNVDRPYPRAVAGHIEQFSFSPETRQFELTFEEDPLISMPTEIYLPGRWYPKEPQINLEPSGKSSFDSFTRVLSVYPLKEKTRRSILVR
jgi:endoglycosylceramidase